MNALEKRHAMKLARQLGPEAVEQLIEHTKTGRFLLAGSSFESDGISWDCERFWRTKRFPHRLLEPMAEWFSGQMCKEQFAGLRGANAQTELKLARSG